MDLFELLFIALFILFPVLEGILKQRRKQQGGSRRPGQPGRPGEQEPGGSPSRSGGGGAARKQSRPAAEMLPDDLWELMTGERRGGADREEDRGSPWSTDPGATPAGAETGPEGEPGAEPWTVDDEAVAYEPVSAEYTGPEAYSLETPAPPPVERTVPTAAARHRAFHERIDRRPPTRKRRLSPLMRTLRDPDGLRQAVLLKEILGPPKGLA